MKIGFFEIEDWEEPIIRERLLGHDLVFSKEKITPATLSAGNAFDVISGFTDSPITRELIAALPNLKFVTTRSTGFDHIDLVACKERGILAANVPGYGDNTVAEYAFGLMLNLMRKIYASIDQVKETGSFSLTGLRGRDLKGKTLGVIGTGRIGKEVIRIAQGFQMHVIAYDAFPDQAYAREAGILYADLNQVLAGSDIITLHCPLVDSTRHLINRSNIGFIRKGAYLVNTARGPIIETEALVEALQNGTLAGAALDVLEEEGETKDELEMLRLGQPKEEELRTMLENHVLMRMPNVLVTPHNAFNTNEAMRRILEITIANIDGFAQSKPVNILK